MGEQKCIQCGKPDTCYCFQCFEDRGSVNLKEKSWERLKAFVETIYKHYPGAVINGFFLGGGKCAVHFNVGVGGSDSVHVKWNGEVWQTISGDLDIDYLYELEEKLRWIVDPLVSLSLLAT